MDLFIMFGVSNANECFKKWQKIMKSINLEVDFYKLGINSNAKVNKIISNINSQRLKNNPVKVEKNEMIKIITNSI